MTNSTYSAMVLGATGNVGGQIVRLLIESARCERIVVVVRRAGAVPAHSKVTEVVVDMERLEEQVAPHAQGIDVALAAFGIGQGSAKMSDDDVRRIEVEYPRAFCRVAKSGGARVCALMSAAGADPAASARYLRFMGEKEIAARQVGFEFLGLFRPGVILGNSNTPGWLDRTMPFLDWALPSKIRSVHKNELARAMVAQSEAALDAAGAETVKVLEFKEMRPFFGSGDRAGR